MDKLYFTSGFDIALISEEIDILNMLLSDVAEANPNSIERLVFEKDTVQYVDYSLMFGLIIQPIDKRQAERKKRIYNLENTDITKYSQQELDKIQSQYIRLTEEFSQDYTLSMLVKFQARRLSALQEELNYQLKQNEKMKKEYLMMKEFNESDVNTINILIEKTIEFIQKIQSLKRKNDEYDNA